MTFAELSNTLPNGFHDAEINSITIDFSGSLIRMDLTLDFSPVGRTEQSEYRRAQVIARGVHTFVLGSLDGVESLNGPLDTSGHEARDENVPDDLKALGKGHLLYSFFVDDWNRCIYIAAEEAELVWPKVAEGWSKVVEEPKGTDRDERASPR